MQLLHAGSAQILLQMAIETRDTDTKVKNGKWLAVCNTFADFKFGSASNSVRVSLAK